MAVPTAYLTSVKNTAAILDAVQRAGVPERFTFEFLKQLGFGSSTDRPLIAVLKSIGFLTESSEPTELYRRYKNKSLARAVMAQALRQGYADLFAVDTEAHAKTTGQLSGMFGRLSDKGEAVCGKMATTFKTLAGLADFSSEAVSMPLVAAPRDAGEDGQRSDTDSTAESLPGTSSAISLRHDIHVHLPVSTDVAVYDAIFRSLKANLL